MKMLLIFSHKATEEQVNDAKNSLGVSELVEMPEGLKALWSQIPAEMNHAEIEVYLEPVKAWISETGGDYVLVAGEATAFYSIVQFIETRTAALVVVATTKRESVEEMLPDGSVKKTFIFRHVRFREVEAGLNHELTVRLDEVLNELSEIKREIKEIQEDYYGIK